MLTVIDIYQLIMTARRKTQNKSIRQLIMKNDKNDPRKHSHFQIAVSTVLQDVSADRDAVQQIDAVVYSRLHLSSSCVESQASTKSQLQRTMSLLKST